MTSMKHSNRLHTHLANMIALEAAIERKLEVLIPEVSAHSEVRSLLTGFLAMTKVHQESLATRLQTIAEGVHIPEGTAAFLPVNTPGLEADYPVSTALQTVSNMFHQAVSGYAILHSLSTRLLDSPYIAKEGTSYHLTHQHAENYIRAIQQIDHIINDVVLWELDQERSACQCGCLSCRSGICLCAHAGRAFISNTWAAARPNSDEQTIYVHHPKHNSPAAIAGLQTGDVILGANGAEFKSFWDIFGVLENTKSGESVRLAVRRGPDVVEEITMTLP